MHTLKSVDMFPSAYSVHVTFINMTGWGMCQMLAEYCLFGGKHAQKWMTPRFPYKSELHSIQRV